MPEEELDEQIHWEAEQYIPFDINDVNLYHEIISHDAMSQNMDVLLVACKRDKIAQFTRSFRRPASSRSSSASMPSRYRMRMR